MLRDAPNSYRRLITLDCREVDPGNGTGGLVGSWRRSVVVDGADDDEDETEESMRR